MHPGNQNHPPRILGSLSEWRRQVGPKAGILTTRHSHWTLISYFSAANGMPAWGAVHTGGPSQGLEHTCSHTELRTSVHMGARVPSRLTEEKPEMGWKEPRAASPARSLTWGCDPLRSETTRESPSCGLGRAAWPAGPGKCQDPASGEGPCAASSVICNRSPLQWPPRGVSQVNSTVDS